MTDRFEQFSFIISGIYRKLQKIKRDEMIKRGYKGAFAQYLATLSRYEEGLTSTELCEICDKDKAAVSRIIAEMEEKGIVGPFQGSKPRTILVTKEQWQAMRSGQPAQMDFDDLQNSFDGDME